MPSDIQSGVAGQVRNQALWQNQLGKSSALDKLGLQDLQGVTLKSSRSPEALVNSKEIFKDYFRTEVKAMTEGMNPRHVEQFTKLSEVRLSQILDGTFGKMEDRLLAGKFVFNPKGHMKKANNLAQEFFKQLVKPAMQTKIDDLRAQVKDKAENRQTLVKPQIFTDDKGNISVMKAGEQIENLVLKGGGGKGIGYPPALAEMQRVGMLDGLKQVVGTSAGALTAVAVAVGQSADQFDVLVNPMPLLFGTNPFKTDVYPEISSTVGNLSPLPATKMVATLDQLVGNKVNEFLSATKPGDLSAMAEKYANANNLSKNDVLARLATLRNPDYTSDRSGKMVTFSDMKMLHAMAPDNFREIQLTGYDSTRREGLLFNAETTPDLPVVFGARISMAHPAIATAIKLDDKHGFGNHALTDGGIYSNTPLEALYDNDRGLASIETNDVSEFQALHEKTMVMIFDDSGKAYSTLHGAPESREVSNGFGMKAAKLVANNPNMDKDWLFDKGKEYHSGPGNFVVFHGKVGTMGLALEKTKEFAQLQSTLKALEQIEQRIDAPSCVTYKSVDAVFKSLSDTEKQLILMDGEPRREDFSGPRAEEDFRIANVLFTRIEMQMGG